MNDGLNYEAWARNAIAFIRERGLEGEFSDWCGGWPVPVKATAPMIAAAPLLLEALEKCRRWAEDQRALFAEGDTVRNQQTAASWAFRLKYIDAAISSARGGQ